MKRTKTITPKNCKIINRLLPILLLTSLLTQAQDNPPLPGSGLRQHPFLYAGEWDHRNALQTLWVVRDGKVVWSYTVWEFTQADVPGIKLFNIQEVTRMANGNTVICNWCADGIKAPKDWPGSVQVLEVTPDKKVVWALRSWQAPADLGPASSIQLLDQPGIAENGDLQR